MVNDLILNYNPVDGTTGIQIKIDYGHNFDEHLESCYDNMQAKDEIKGISSGILWDKTVLLLQDLDQSEFCSKIESELMDHFWKQQCRKIDYKELEMGYKHSLFTELYDLQTMRMKWETLDKTESSLKALLTSKDLTDF